MNLMVLIIKTKTPHPSSPASACSHMRVSGPEPIRLQQVHSGMAGYHLPAWHSENTAVVTAPQQGHSELHLRFLFSSFTVTWQSLFLDLIVVESIAFLSPHPMGQCRPAGDGMSQCLKALVQSPKELSIPTWAEHLHVFTQKYELNTLCVAYWACPVTDIRTVSDTALVSLCLWLYWRNKSWRQWKPNSPKSIIAGQGKERSP